MEKQNINDYNYFQRKINEKAVFGHKRSIQQTTSDPRRTQPHSQPTQQLPTTSNSPKGRMYKEQLHMYGTFGQKSAYVHDFWPKTRVYREGSGKKQAKAKPIKGSVNGQTYYKMRHRNREKPRASQ